ncbi:MAG: molybdopterin-dependent oxidoreductase [Dehalococcoidia bacterium]|nr:molybdopterin-dependent oxidoreductase [Dehalococcoidia bacterium]
MQQRGGISRRSFLGRAAAAGAGLAIANVLAFEPWHLEASDPVQIGDPFKVFPDRGWEKAYRNLFQSDSSYVFTCAPNDTHDCLLRAHVKNGVVVRINPTYGYGQAQDLHGNGPSHRWDPRACQKGLALARKFYGDRRVKGAMVRKGFKEWADAGFPRDATTGKPQMDMTKRGEDGWLKMSWDEAFALAAKTYVNVATTYSGAKGTKLLEEQGYDHDMIEATHEAGTRTIKMRGGMPLLGVGRIQSFNRFANGMALLDDNVRKVGKSAALGSRAWDSYAWHTDLAPGHPMVTGQQGVDFDLFAPEYADLIVTFGMNWISTKMPDGHWLAEARMKGTKIITIATDYQSTSNRADEVVMIRPATDGAFMLACAQYIIANRLYDEAHVKRATDLPFLVRMDTRKLLAAKDIVANYQNADLTNYVTMVPAGTALAGIPLGYAQGTQYLPQDLRADWGDFAVWDSTTNAATPVNRDQVGEKFALNPALDGEFDVKLASGQTVKCRTVFSLVKQYLDKDFTPQIASELTWAPQAAIESVAKQVAAAKQKTLMPTGMGPNHFFNAQLKDRAIFLLASLTDNVGHFGGNVGSYSGNYRGSVFNGVPQFIQEDPFDVELDPAKPARQKYYYKGESPHYYNYGDRPLRVGNKNFTGAGHMPTPTKLIHFGNSNSLLGNAKWHYDVVNNTLPKIDAIFVNEWWWTASCEYADIVFGVDSWGEHKLVDASASCTNPFLHIFPRTPLKRIFDTRSDYEVLAGVAKAIGVLTGDTRHETYWRYIHEGRAEVYLQRTFNASGTTRGYDVLDVERKAQSGIPAVMNYRTYPRGLGWEQRFESKPWYTRTGRLEFYRDEAEFIEHGENIPVYREPIDATPHEPNVIVASPHPMLVPNGPDKYGLKIDDLSTETRQVRNVMKPWSELKTTKHPLMNKDSKYKFIFITPKYRHGAHSTPVDIDWMAMLFGPFGDMFRQDKRSPWTGEGYVEVNPKDAHDLGIEDGDYVWFDADPEDRPYRGWKKDDAFYKVARGMARARYNNAIQPGVLRMWYNMYLATKGSVKGAETREDGLAKNPETNYQAMFRHGGHQSATRAWLGPTLQTETLTRKPYYGQILGKGYEADVHTVVGAPKESFVKLEKAEDGGMDAKGLWLPAKEGLRPTYESDLMKQYLAGKFYAA